ncbi:Haloacid dehalogenase-like hydrolase (HAD) superfamily protein, partial [Thalictrum thalictroides]
QIRPFCCDFLKFCFAKFDVGVWSSRTKKNVDSVINFIMPDKKQELLFCWDQSHCTETGFNTVENDCKPLVFKELKKLWDKHEPNLPWEKGEYNESNTLLLDDSPYKALLNPPNTAIFPNSYDFQNLMDNSLGPGGDLRMYLERLATAENIQNYIQQNPFGQRAVTSKNPSWVYYLKVISANKFCLAT